MAQIYSTRFLSAEIDTAEVDLAVPDGFRWVIRDIDVYSPNGSLVDSIACFVTIESVPFYWTTTGPDTTTIDQWRGRQVAYPGDHVVITTTGDIWVTMSGYQLTEP